MAHAGDDYATTFTPEADQAYQEDINVWVYTQGFAERFGMPEKWVSGKLEGAHAAAFRVETSSARLMFPHKGKDVSKPVRRCVLDLFLPNEADIPWANDKVADIWWYTPEAPTYLMPQREEDKQWQRRPVGIPHPGKKARRPLVYFDEGTINLRKYRKKLYPGLDYLSFSIGCYTPPDDRTTIEFREDKAWKGDNYHVLHEVVLPAGFMKRLRARWRKDSRQPASGERENVIQGSEQKGGE